MLDRAHGTQTKRKRKPNPKPGPKNKQKLIKPQVFSFSEPSAAGSSKEAPKFTPGALPRSLPGPPGDFLAGPRRPKEAPRAAQEPPSPEASRRPCYVGLLGARFSTRRGAIFEASAASSAAFREAALTASPPFQSTAPEAKIAKECQSQKPAHRPSKQPLATKRLASKRWSAVSRR